MKILVAYYSMYGHVHKLAKAVEEGAREVAGVEVVVRRIAEFPETEKYLQSQPFTKAVLDAQQEIPVCTVEDLAEADGLLFGSPTRYGNMIAQAKALIDRTAQLWLKGAMEGKPVGVFCSTASTHGGQETTLLSMMIPFLHLGMLVVGVPYSTTGMIHTEARGGTPYGATTLAGPQGELHPTPEDLAIAKAQGKRVAEITVAVRGKKS